MRKIFAILLTLILVTGCTSTPAEDVTTDQNELLFEFSALENLFEVDGYGDLSIVSIHNNEDGSVGWSLSKQKELANQQTDAYQQASASTTTWEIDSMTHEMATEEQVKQVENVIYAYNYVFNSQLENYGLEDDIISLYHATQLVIWTIVEGWSTSDVYKQLQVSEDEILNALADQIYTLYLDLYEYAIDTENRNYYDGVQMYDINDQSNLLAITQTTYFSPEVTTSAYDNLNVYRSALLYYAPLQSHGYVFDGDLAYTYHVSIEDQTDAIRIVNQNGTPQTTFSTNVTDPIGSAFYIELLEEELTDANITIKVETECYVRENPVVYMTQNSEYASIIQTKAIEETYSQEFIICILKD